MVPGTTQFTQPTQFDFSWNLVCDMVPGTEIPVDNKGPSIADFLRHFSLGPPLKKKNLSGIPCQTYWDMNVMSSTWQ